VADPYFISYNPSEDAGERLPPEVREEIAEVAPSAVEDGSISEAKLKDGAVATAKLADGAVSTAKIATNGVETANIKGGAVTTAKLADESVTPAKCDTGVVTMKDSDGNDIEAHGVRMTETEYSALGAPDPNTFYFLSS